MDPTAVGIEVPKAAMSRLVVIMRLANSDVALSGQGRIMLPCTPTGAYEVVPDMALQLDDGRVIRIVHPTTAPVSWVRMEGGRLMCSSLIGIDIASSVAVIREDGSADFEGGQFRINPMMIEQIQSVFFDGRRNTMTLRIGSDQAMDLVSTKPSPRVPMFNSVALIPALSATNGNAILMMPEVMSNNPDAEKHTLHNSKAITQPDGTLLFSFSRFSSAMGAGPSTRELPGVYELVSDTLSFDQEARALTLELRPVSDQGPRPIKKGPKRYTVSIERNEVLMMIRLRPAGAPKDKKAAEISSHIGKLSDSYRAMGKDVSM
jgi:hypothetical protein